MTCICITAHALRSLGVIGALLIFVPCYSMEKGQKQKPPINNLPQMVEHLYSLQGLQKGYWQRLQQFPYERVRWETKMYEVQVKIEELVPMFPPRLRKKVMLALINFSCESGHNLINSAQVCNIQNNVEEAIHSPHGHEQLAKYHYEQQAKYAYEQQVKSHYEQLSKFGIKMITNQI